MAQLKFIAGSFVVLALFLFLLRNLVNTRPPLANAEEPRPRAEPGLLTNFVNSSALVSIVLLLLPLDQLVLA